MPLFHGHTFCQVPRLVDIAPKFHGDMIGKKLERYGSQNRRQIFGRLRDQYNIITNQREFTAFALRANGNNRSTAGLNLLNIAQIFGEDCVMWGDEDRGRLGIH